MARIQVDNGTYIVETFSVPNGWVRRSYWASRADALKEMFFLMSWEAE